MGKHSRSQEIEEREELERLLDKYGLPMQEECFMSHKQSRARCALEHGHRGAHLGIDPRTQDVLQWGG